MAQVKVYAPDGRELLPTNPARARMLVSDGAAVFADGSLHLLRGPTGGVTPMTQSHQNQTNAPGQIVNFTKYFADQRDVYVQNTSDKQISLPFTSLTGAVYSFLLPRGQDPYNLTQSVPFDVIAQSVDFRKMLNRRPSVMRLLTEEEYLEYYRKKAEANKLGLDAAIDRASQRQQDIQNHRPDASIPPVMRSADQADAQPQVDVHDLVIKDTEIINPRLLGLIAGVSLDVPESQRTSAEKLLSEIQTLVLTDDDLEYIRARGYWKSVKKWAAMQQTERASAQEGDGLPICRDAA